MKVSAEYRKKFLYLGMCLLLALGLFLAENAEAEPIACAVGYGFLYLLAGVEVFASAIKKLVRGKPFSEEMLMSIAAVGAFCIGSFVEGAAVLIFYRVGETFTDMASEDARRSVAELAKVCPETAAVADENGERTVPASEVHIGDIVITRPGEKLPLDGIIVSGSASVDTAAVTGEAVPRQVSDGDSVYAGCVCLDGVLRIRVTAEHTDTAVANMIRLTETAAERKAKTERFITRFAAIYTPCVVSAAAVYAVAMPLILGGGWISCIKNALNFLVICCPCALVLSVPLAFFCACGRATRSGVLIKGGASMESLAKLGAVAFDKTGTVTDGMLEVASVNPVGISRAALVKYAACAEHFSNHPLAEAIKREYGEEVRPESVEAFTELGGYGVRARIDGMHILVGSARLMREEGIDGELPDAGGATAVYVAANGVFRGMLTLRDRIKPDAAETVALLRACGVKRIAVFSGDGTAAAREAAERIGADEGFGDLLPADKCRLLESEMKTAVTAFVGDGINDAPAIAAADVGIAMGALGSDAAVEAADVVIMGDGLSRIPAAMETAARALRAARENIWLCLIVKAGVLAASAFGYAPMWLAVVADVGAAIAAVTNSVLSARAGGNNGKSAEK